MSRELHLCLSGNAA